DGPHAAQADLARAPDDQIRDRAAVVGRLRVGHAAHGSEAARDRGARARADVFLVLLAWLAQVHVQVDEAGRDDLAGGVEGARGRVGRAQAGPDLGDLAVDDEDIGGLVDLV